MLFRSSDGLTPFIKDGYWWIGTSNTGIAVQGPKGEQGDKGAGKQRLEGKEYIMQDGDIVHFRFNV